MNAKALKEIFSEIENLPLSENELLLKLDGQGTIQKIILKSRKGLEWTNFQYYEEILPGKNIGDLYQLPKKKELARISLALASLEDALKPELLFDGRFSYPSRNIFEKYEDFHNFYSDLPFSRLFVRHQEALGFFGVVRLSLIGERVFRHRFYPVVLGDAAGKVRGFNEKFFNYFRERHPRPMEMIGEPLSRFSQPDPLKAVTGPETEFLPLPGEKWRSEYSCEFSRPDPNPLKKFLDADRLDFVSGQWQWAASQAFRGFLPFSTPLDSEANDFKLELAFTLLEGEFPSIIAGGVKDYRYLFPDLSGYLFGPDGSGSFFQIKKESYVIRRVPFDSSRFAGKCSLTVFKRGAAIALFLNGELIAGYRDTDPAASAAGFQCLYSRGECRLALHSLEMSTLPAAPPFQQGYNEANLTGAPGESFRFHHLPDISLAYPADYYSAFVFYNITPLKRNIDLLRRANAQVVRERDRYKVLALGAEDSRALIGESPAMVTLRKESQRAAEARMTVLIEGETGTGKEVLAHFIHDHSGRKKEPFVKVDCASLPESLLESELFGVDKGAFTGAVETRKGKLEAAHGGTLFLDELANINLATQAKLLQFLENFTLQRLGGEKNVRVDAFVIAATNQPLKMLVEKGLFRDDLYYRLCAVRLQLPPLRDRLEDVERLCTHFLHLYNEKLNRGIKGFSPEGFQKLLGHPWPGNIRELENVVKNAMIFCDSDVIGAGQIQIAPVVTRTLPDLGGPPIPRGNARALTREHIVELLQKNNGIAGWAARDAQVSPATFFRKLKKFKINRGGY